MKNLLVTEANYDQTLASIETLMAKGSQNLSKDDKEQLATMAVAVQQYEDDLYGEIPPPSTPEGIAELATYRERLHKQQQG